MVCNNGTTLACTILVASMAIMMEGSVRDRSTSLDGRRGFGHFPPIRAEYGTSCNQCLPVEKPQFRPLWRDFAKKKRKSSLTLLVLHSSRLGDERTEMSRSSDPFKRLDSEHDRCKKYNGQGYNPLDDIQGVMR